MNSPVQTQQKRFQLYLIKPSHYDDDGYVIQWFRSAIPSNTLAALYGLAVDCRERQVLGPDIAIDIFEADETNTRIRPERIAAHDQGRRRARPGGAGRRAVQPVSARHGPRPAVARRGHPGGDRRLPRLRLHRHAARACRRTCRRRSTWASRSSRARRRAGSTGAARRGGRAAEAALQLHGRPAGAGGRAAADPAARADRAHRRPHDQLRRRPRLPVPVLFCTIINVQGRKSRYRTADDVEELVRRNLAQGVDHFFITDDNFARNRNWEPIFDRLIAMREKEKAVLPLHHPGRYALPQDPALHRKAARAGRDARVHRAREHQPGQPARRPRRSRTASPNTGKCCWTGKRPAASPMPATSWAFPTTRPKASCATSRSSSASCRWICWSSSS